MDKKIVHKGESIFQQVLEDKRVIRQCIQTGGDIKKLAKEGEWNYSFITKPRIYCFSRCY